MNGNFSSIIDMLSESIYWMDVEGRILGCNRNQARIIGVNDPALLIGKTLYDVAKLRDWPDSVAELVYQNNLEIMQTRSPRIIEEEVILEGNLHHFLSYKNPWIGNNNEVLGIVGISLDITERKNFEIELLKAKEKAEAANKAKSEFLANLSHDLRTPLSSLVVLNNYIAKNSKEEIHSLAVDAEQCAEQLLELIEEVLEITKINAGQFPNEEQVFEFQLLIDAIVKLMAPAAKQKDLALTVDYDPALPKFVIGRYHPIHRILMNLLSNAIKFTHEGQVTVSIQLLEKNDQQIKIKLCVQDTGIGIAEHNHQRIFEQFERLNAAYEGNYQGRGLGLYIVKQFADLLGCTVNVQSAEGEGTSMELEFPLTIANNPSPKDIPSITTSTIKAPILKKAAVENHIVNTASPLANNQLKILLVEDSPIAARVGKIALANLVSEIDVAETGRKAIELATQRQYDLIFLDIGLPDMSGLAVSKAIRQFENENNLNAIPIIALTAHLDSSRTALNAGIQQIIYKPMTADKAEIILKNWAQSPNAQHNAEPVKPQTQPIDLSIAEKLVGNRALAQTMLDEFIKTLPTDVQKIKDAFDTKDKEVLKDAVHYLNGGSSYAGVPLLKKACNSLEVAITDNFSDAEITELFEDICSEAGKVLELYSAMMAETMKS